MSVLVKSMSIPDNCESCRFATGFGFCLAKSDNFCGYTNYRKRPEWCPLVEVPELHGRLIDENELTISTDNIVSKIMIFGGQVCYTQSDIDNASTVIEAEGE